MRDVEDGLYCLLLRGGMGRQDKEGERKLLQHVSISPALVHCFTCAKIVMEKSMGGSGRKQRIMITNRHAKISEVLLRKS